MDVPALLAKIQRFCDRHDIAPSSFGRLAINDGNFVQEVAAGTRSPTMRTVNTVVLFMEGYKNDRGRNKAAAAVGGRHAKK